MNANYSNTSMLDMVFEHRNKAYGAYVLRRDSNKTVKQAMLSILSVVTLFCLGNFIRENMHSGKKVDYNANHVFITSEVGPITKPVEKIKPQIQPPKHQQQAQGIKTAADPEKKIVANDKAQDSIPANKDIANVESGLKANSTATSNMGATDGKGTERVFEVAKEVMPAKSEVVGWAEEMPEFPGGEKALLSFIAKHTEYPDMERDNGIAGKVITRFTVNEDGTISDIQILRSPSSGFNREVTRVIKMLPTFKPGKQHGRAVRVSYNVPFTFSLN